MASANPFYDYYASQVGGGGSSSPYYRSSFRVQAGRGWFGNLFRSAWSYLSPLVRNAAKHAGAEALNVGSNIMKEVIANPNETVRGVVGRHGKDGLMSIAKAAASGARSGMTEGQSGKGRRTRRQSTVRRRQARVAPSRGVVRRSRRKHPPPPSASTIRDIFSPPSP